VKKLWKKPELVVLVRARPEESVLQACKIPNSVSINPDYNFAGYCKDQGNEDCSTCATDQLS
jgi:hypothetical protein